MFACSLVCNMKIIFTQAAQEWASNEVSLWNGVAQLAGVGPGGSATVLLPDEPSQLSVRCGTYVHDAQVNAPATITVRWTLHPPEMVVDIK